MDHTECSTSQPKEKSEDQQNPWERLEKLSKRMVTMARRVKALRRSYRQLQTRYKDQQETFKAYAGWVQTLYAENRRLKKLLGQLGHPQP